MLTIINCEESFVAKVQYFINKILFVKFCFKYTIYKYTCINDLYYLKKKLVNEGFKSLIPTQCRYLHSNSNKT